MSIYVVLAILVLGGGVVSLIIGFIARCLDSNLMFGVALASIAIFGIISVALCLCFGIFVRTTPVSEPEVAILELVEADSSDNSYYQVVDEDEYGFTYIDDSKVQNVVNGITWDDIKIYYGSAEPNTGEYNRVVVYRETLREQWWFLKGKEYTHYRYELYLGDNS